MRVSIVLSDTTNAALASLLVLVYSFISGIGGPPSEFRSDPPWIADTLSGGLLVFYMLGAFFVLAGVVGCAFSPFAGRVITTVGGILSGVGNLVSFGIGAGREASASVILAAALIPLILVLWLPHVAAHRSRAAR